MSGTNVAEQRMPGGRMLREERLADDYDRTSKFYGFGKR